MTRTLILTMAALSRPALTSAVLTDRLLSEYTACLKQAGTITTTVTPSLRFTSANGGNGWYASYRIASLILSYLRFLTQVLPH